MNQTTGPTGHTPGATRSAFAGPSVDKIRVTTEGTRLCSCESTGSGARRCSGERTSRPNSHAWDQQLHPPDQLPGAGAPPSPGYIGHMKRNSRSPIGGARPDCWRRQLSKQEPAFARAATDRIGTDIGSGWFGGVAPFQDDWRRHYLELAADFAGHGLVRASNTDKWERDGSTRTASVRQRSSHRNFRLCTVRARSSDDGRVLRDGR